jgi:hypothetical protein
VLLFLGASAADLLTIAGGRNVRDRRHLGFPAVTGETDHAETSSHQGCEFRQAKGHENARRERKEAGAGDEARSWTRQAGSRRHDPNDVRQPHR